MKRLLVPVLVLAAWSAGAQEPEELDEPDRRPNVLFVSFDDLNDWIGPLGGLGDVPVTPAFDRLARLGTTFANAHCTAPACNPSRTSVLTGLRPTSSGVYENRSDWRAALPGVTTLPMLFRRNGYETIGFGKTFHAGDQDAGAWVRHESPPNPLRVVEHLRVGKLAWGGIEGRDERFPDRRMALEAAQVLAARHVRPFFLAVGFKKPHLPWIVPQACFDRYDAGAVRPPPVREDDLDDVPPSARALDGEGASDHAKVLEAGAWPALTHAYLAAVSYADQELATLLDALAAGPNARDTIVCVWSDHGFHLGEKERWRKFTLWEESTRVPFFLAVPGLTAGGERVEAPVDLVHVLPTLAELCRLQVEPDVRARWDGTSLRPLLADPRATWQHAALTTHLRGNHAVRTERWRYVRYADGGEELYDHATDPHEWTNLAGDPRTRGVREELAAWLPREEAPPAPLRPRSERDRDD